MLYCTCCDSCANGKVFEFIFSRQCLQRSLEFKPKCPKCGCALEDRPDHVFPNFTCKVFFLSEKKFFYFLLDFLSVASLTKKCREISNQMKQMNADLVNVLPHLLFHVSKEFRNNFLCLAIELEIFIKFCRRFRKYL